MKAVELSGGRAYGKLTSASGIQAIPLAVLCLWAAIYVGNTPISRAGMDFLWLLPFSLGLCLALFPWLFSYHRGGVGLKVFYAAILVRYLLSPVLIAASGGEMASWMIYASPEGYHFSLLVMPVELFVYLGVIQFLWPRRFSKLEEEVPRLSGPCGKKAQSVDGVTLGGLLLVGILLVIISLRGLSGVQSSMGFLLLTKKHEDSLVDSYAVVAVQAIKSFLFIGIAVWCRRRYNVRGGALWVFIALLAALLNLSIYFGYNRSLVLQTAIATGATVIFLFPRARKFIVVILAPVAGGILYSMITLKQFDTSVSQGPVKLTVASASQTVEAYVGGPWTLATSFDAATASAHQVSFLNILRTFTDNFFLFKVPGFTWPNEFLAGIPSVIDLYNSYTWPALGAMLPLGGEMWFYGGDILGPLLVLLAPGVVAAILVEMDIRARVARNAQAKFIYTWMAVLFGLAMCYCSITFVWSISKFALPVAFMFWLNNRILLRNRW